VALSTRALKVASGMGAVALCGVSGVLVAIDPKPSTAPLRPPVADPAPAPDTSGLLIPQSCDTGATLDPSLLPVAQAVRAAASAAARRLILASLTASQRLEVEGYVRSLRRSATGLTGSCGDATGTGGSIAPSVIDAPPSTQPLINTYVS
jgi:hypothetical protein